MDKKGIFLENRHISLLLSAVILMGFFVFISGYFFGKKKTVEKFYSKVDQESLADHVYYSVCSNYGNYDQDLQQESTEDSSVVTEKDVSESLRVKSQEHVDKQKEDLSGLDNSKNMQESKQNLGLCSSQVKNNLNIQDVSIVGGNEKPEDANQEKFSHGYKVQYVTGEENNTEETQKEVSYQAGEQYYAELVGFGSQSAANTFCNKLKRRGVTVKLKKRRSRTSRGRNVYWYQAVTEKFDNKSDLVAFIDIIKDRENLKGVKIIEC